MRYFKLGSLLAMVALSLSLAQPAKAYLFGFSNGNTSSSTTLTLNSVPLQNKKGESAIEDSGWYSGAQHLSSTTNYFVARPNDLLVPDAEGYRNYFVFDISTLSTEITLATLTINSYEVTSNETYTLFDVTTPIHNLIDGPFTLSTFNDLGTGMVYGAHDYMIADSYKPLTLMLNAAFLANLNAAILNQSNNGRFAIGGAVDTAGNITEPPGGVVVNPGPVPGPARNVPEPSTLLLLGAALVGLAAWRRKHAA